MTLPGRITTPRLVLRVADKGDAAALLPHFDNWGVIRWLTGPAWPVTLAGKQAFLADCSTLGPFLEEYRVIERAGQAIGGIGWGYRRDKAAMAAGEPELGYWLGEAHWGQGIMGEAAQALVGAISTLPDVQALRSGVIVGNEASLRLQMRLGFSVCGQRRVMSNALGHEVDVIETRLALAGRAKAG
ncbi:MAG: GNAT family N-acetyltransferase [Beijerinckiaceae bacterium]|nr:GNAT family N-acetyltransferase [Beijerinckiaceae bacterium]